MRRIVASRAADRVATQDDRERDDVEKQFEPDVEWAVDEDVRRVPGRVLDLASASKVCPRKAVSTASLICRNVSRPRCRNLGDLGRLAQVGWLPHQMIAVAIATAGERSGEREYGKIGNTPAA